MSSLIYVANHSHLPKLRQAFITFYVHQHLDWLSIDSQIDQGNILCLEINEHLSALLSLSSSSHHTSWVNLFAVRNDREADLRWEQLFTPSIERLCVDITPIDIYTIATWDWYSRLITNRQDFTFSLNIVTLECDITKSLVLEPEPIHPIRTFSNRDNMNVYAIDQSAFQPPWQLDNQNLTAAWEQSTFSRIIEIDNQPAGYILAASSDGSCHLSRIAIKPEFAGKGYGSLLLSSLIDHCQHKKIQRITVNTQETNLASLQLYKKFGFELTGERIPVFFSRQSVNQ